LRIFWKKEAKKEDGVRIIWVIMALQKMF